MTSTSWHYFNPDFSYDEIAPHYTTLAWLGHKRFAYDLVRYMKPNVIVELGTYRGTSLFAMVQAVKDGGLETEVFGIDTWQGDLHMGKFDEAYWNEVNLVRSKYYDQQNVHFIRKLFDEAKDDILDGSIDILHIDGTHTYEAVKNDWNNYKKKLSPNGVALFHDICVTEIKDFGVHKFWSEIKQEHQTLEFHHSYGLGVLFNGEIPEDLGRLQDVWMSYYHNTHKLEISSHIINELRNRVSKIENSIFWRVKNFIVKIMHNSLRFLKK